MTKTNFLTTTIMTILDPWLAVKLPFLTILLMRATLVTIAFINVGILSVKGCERTRLRPGAAG